MSMFQNAVLAGRWANREVHNGIGQSAQTWIVSCSKKCVAWWRIIPGTVVSEFMHYSLAQVCVSTSNEYIVCGSRSTSKCLENSGNGVVYPDTVPMAACGTARGIRTMCGAMIS